MSEPTVATATGPPKGKAKKKILGLPMPVAVGGIAALAAFGYIWWRGRHKTAASASTTTSSSVNQAQLDQIQAELDQLLGQGSASTGTGTGGGTGGGGGTSTKTTTSTTTPITVPPSQPVNATNPVKGLHITDIGTTSVTGSWSKSAGATSYLITVLEGGKVLKTQHAAGTMARVGNLKRGTQYEFRVRAQPGGKGGSDASVNVTTKGGGAVNPGGPDKTAKKK